MTEHSPVVLDTDIFGAIYIDPRRAACRGHPVEAWRTRLRGRRVLVSFQTRAEILAGFRSANWGERRIADALGTLDAIPTIPADRSVIDAFADLTADCRRAGHALSAKVHTGDRWVAASAVAKGLPLMARDGIYRGAPGVTLLDVT